MLYRRGERTRIVINEKDIIVDDILEVVARALAKDDSHGITEI